MEAIKGEGFLQDLPKEGYLIFRGKLCYGKKNKICGLFDSIISIEEKRVIRLEVIFSNRDEVYYIDPENKAFNRILDRASNSEKLQGRRFRLDLETTLDEEFCLKMIKFYDNSNQNSLKELVKEKIEDVIKEAIYLDIHIEKNSKEELKGIYPKLFIDEDQTDIKEDFLEEEEVNYNLLECLPIIAPINGKKIGQLKEGEKIFVKVSLDHLQKTTEEGEDKGKELKEESSELKLVGEIKEINYDSQSRVYNILIDFDEEFYGIMSFEGNAELKLAIPQEDGDISELLTSKDDLLMYFFIGLFIITFIIITIVLI
ncbi:hypothetical protein [Halonatronum saccharophilum]|uniref:hypothetical protein n=1 Tax=Halonatronum saccharophilum TaxID=150060 RepID=UPI000480F10E|nr:hypothetical protein [Halonatronum saccharophilum]